MQTVAAKQMSWPITSSLKSVCLDAKVSISLSEDFICQPLTCAGSADCQTGENISAEK